MTVKNYSSKTIKAVSTLAISAVLLGSGFITSSWAMEEEGKELAGASLSTRLGTRNCEKDRESIKRLIYDAQNLEYKKNWQAAKENYLLALEKDPDFSTLLPKDASTAYICLAKTCNQLGDKRSAAEYCTLAIEKDPDSSAQVYTFPAMRYFELQEWQLTAEHYERLLEKFPHLHILDYLHAGYAEAKANQLDKARVYFEKVINDTVTKISDRNLPSGIIELMEKVLAPTESNALFREWTSRIKK